MGSSVSVTRSNFTAEVIEKSYEKPILVDFFAHWCGPCQMLKPMLERLAQEYDFVLAKIDIDANPELAQEYQVEGVPDVKIVVNGEVADGFVGVLPEPQLRGLMAQLNLKSVIEESLETAYNQAATGNLDQAQTILADLLQQYPNNHNLILEAANFYMEAGQLDTAEKLLGKIQEHEREYYAHAKGLLAEIRFKRAVNEPAGDRDLDRTYQQAGQAAMAKDYETALMLFLEIVTRDRTYKDDAGRKGMLAIFDLLGNDHPVTRHYRKMLTMTLY
jgi:putative thioredoxin